MSIRLLLLQTREPDDPVLEEERRSFAEKTALELDRIAAHDLLSGPPGWDRIRRFDGLLIGGSGDYYVSKAHLPNFEQLLGFFGEVVTLGFPTFASCFGFQLMTAALGGRIVHDTASMEVGTYELRLTEAGQSDPLLGTLPESFMGQLGRKDRAETLPEGFENLVTSDRCPNQCFRVPDQPIWATQFHPELDGHTNRGRYLRYLEGYAEHLTPAEQKAALERYRDSPETEKLMARWVDLVFRS